MATTYDEKTRKFRLRWKDYVKEQKGEKNPYGRLMIGWKEKKKPTKAQLKELLKKYDALCNEKEEESKLLAEHIIKAQNGDNDGVINAADYFLTLPDSELCKNSAAVTLSKARGIATEFGEFLQKNYPTLFLHEVREAHLDAYFEPIKDRSYETLGRRLMRINYFFRRIMKRQQDSKLPYRNPCDDYNLEKVRGDTTVTRKQRFTVQQLRSLLTETMTVKGYTKGIYRSQLYAMVYFHAVTGWRTSDITGLKWSEVDLNERIITKVHAKTKKDETRTKLYITDIMMDILVSLREMCKDDPMNLDPDYVFPLRPRGGSPKGGMAHSGYVMMKAYVDQFRAKHGLTQTKKTGIRNLNPICVHSFRDTVIQELAQTDFNTDKINYLVGHSTGDVNNTNYLRFEMEAMRTTKTMVEHLERVIGAQFWNDSARLAHEKGKQDERLKAMRAGMSITQGGFMVDIDPYTGKQVRIAL